MKYKTEPKDKSKRRHKNNLTKGAFGKVKTPTKRVFLTKRPKRQTKAGKIPSTYVPYKVKGKVYEEGVSQR